MTQKLNKIFFSLLIFLLPINLGKHFISTDAYIRARLIDYLVPTIWVQDVLILVILILSIFGKTFKPDKKWVRLGLVFLAAFLPSVFIGENFTASAHFFLRLVLYVGFMLFVSSNVKPARDFPKILKILGVSVILVGILAIFQWRAQGSVFNNYLFFGEQPYNSATFNIARVNLFGPLKIPAYGTFRHPNTFAGFLTAVLFWMYSEFHIGRRSKLLSVAFLLGFAGIILTFSQVAMVALFLSMMFFLVIKKFGKKGVIASLIVTSAIFIFALFLPTLSRYEQFATDPSVYRRANLLRSSYQMISEHPVFGTGLNNFTVYLQDYLPLTQILVFNQPVHNAFVLIVAESGSLSFLVLFAVVIVVAFSLLNNNFGYPAVFFVTLLQFLILGSFDHYLWTAHQTQILFWLTLGLALAYTDRDAQV